MTLTRCLNDWKLELIRMKKNTKARLWFYRVVRRLRMKKKDHRERKSESRHGDPGKDRAPVPIFAPKVLCIYSDKNHWRTTQFLQDLREACKTGRIVKICFRDTQHITAAAGILTLSEIDRLVSHYGRGKFQLVPPAKSKAKFGVVRNTVDQVFQQIGLYKLLGKNSFQASVLAPNVECWRVESGTVAQSETAGLMLRAIGDRVPRAVTSSLYRGAIEALSNCVEHAYPSARKDGLNIACCKWWMFTAVIDCRLVVIMCDLGVGIPTTIHKTQELGLIQQIFQNFGFTAVNDAGWIKTATLVKETRTAATNRGKGGGDLRNLIKVDPSARLAIYSNKGCYIHTTLATRNGKSFASPEYLMDHRNSILGTIVEWSVDIGMASE